MSDVTEGTGVETFRTRAAAEAERYGADSWVFVRELLQNARDARARRVWIQSHRKGDRERILVSDDGAGMSFEHARRYLFTLYASSKGTGGEDAGHFGIGFWSILRFRPDAVVIRSATSPGTGWEVRLDGSLENVEQRAVVMDRGTEIILERPSSGTDLEERLLRAARADARFLRCRSQPSRPLEVRVNGRVANASFGLPVPSLRFVRRGLRGVVALGREARVDLFAFGLRVRTTGLLEDLLINDGRSRRLELGGELPGGLLPRVLLDSDHLNLLLARGDAREDRALRRLVALARRELARLVRVQLDRCVPRPWWARALDGLRGINVPARSRPAVVTLVVAVAVGAVLGGVLSSQGVDWIPRPGRGGSEPGGVAADHGVAPLERRAYTDLAGGYGGPTVAALGRRRWEVDLRYRPAERRPLFAALRIVGMAEDGTPVVSRIDERMLSAPGEGPWVDGLDIDMDVDADDGRVRLPVPSGHVLDPESVELTGPLAGTLVGTGDEPELRLNRPFRGRLRYRTHPARVSAPLTGGFWPALPEPASRLAGSLRAAPADERVAAALTWVRSRVVYDRSAAAGRRLRADCDRGAGLLTAALTAGGGDCDVQSSLLAAILEAAGTPARMAVGFVGRDGSALPGLHAWVEYRDGDGRWQVADASAGQAGVIGSTGAAAGPDRVAAAPPLADGGWAGRAQLRPLLSAGVIAGLGAAGLALATGLLLRGARGTRLVRTLNVDHTADVSGLLAGAIQQPRAFAAVPTMFTRPLLHVVGGRRCSLRRARALARRGALFSSSGGSDLGVAAAARGALVLDGRHEGARMAGDSFGAIDLDTWDALLARSVETLWTRAVEAALSMGKAPCMVRVARGAGAAMATLELPVRGVLEGGRRLAVVDGDGPLAGAAASHTPGLAALAVACEVARRWEVPAARRSRVLGALARAAIAREAAAP